MITGFPGETEDDVEELKSFLTKIQFDRVGIFTYSHEEGTSAFNLPELCRYLREYLSDGDKWGARRDGSLEVDR